MPEQVIKKDGSIEPYSEEKVRNSLTKIGLSPEDQENILNLIRINLPKIISTKELFKYIFRNLNYPYKTRYNLNRALKLLGPTGFPFEHFIAHLLKTNGYQTETNLILKGKCVSHEIDVLAEKDNESFLIESKFHTKDIKNDVKVVLYFYARFLDLKENNFNFKPWLWSNTKFTQDAIDFAECRKIKLTSPSYPKNNLYFLIEKEKLYPITVLSSLSLEMASLLIKEDIILVKDILNQGKEKIGKILGKRAEVIDKIFTEASILNQ